MADSKTTIKRKTARTSPYPGLAVKAALLAVTLLCPGPSSSEEIRPVTSPNGRMLASVVQRGERRALMTEIWLARAVGASAERIRTYPGAAGPLGFLPDGSALVYLERSLRYPAFGSYLAGGRALPIVKNRIWALMVDSREETRWPLPPELNPLDIAVSPDGRMLAVRGEWDGVVNGGTPGLWSVDRTGQATQLWIGRTTGAPRWSGDGAKVNFVESETTSKGVKFVHVETGEVGAETASDTASVRAVPEIHGTHLKTTLSDREQISLQRALGALQRGMARYSRMNSAVHRADRHREKDTRKTVERMFETLYKQHKKLRISKASCLRVRGDPARTATEKRSGSTRADLPGTHVCPE